MVAKSLNESDRRALLEEMSALEPDADLAAEGIQKVFLPLPEHRRVLGDQIVLVLGERGVGKSALFHFLQTPAGASLLGRDEKSRAVGRLWIVGFSETGMDHAPPAAIEELARGPEPVEDTIRRFWLGHLIGRIADTNDKAVPEPPPFVAVWRENPSVPSHWLPAMEDPARYIPWLDQLERALASQGRTLVVTYDHLDKIGVRSREIRRRVLPPLLALWLSQSNRYRRVRAKIFLRRDLFDESVANTADVSKLLARAETLRWSVSALYRLLIRHLAIHDRLREWLISGKWKIQLGTDDQLGWMPPEDLPEEGKTSQQTLMAHIVGERMGSGTDPRSGYSWTWVPNHLEDAHGIIAPRSVITLFKSAASRALNETPSGQYTRILAPDELKEGLRETSYQRVVEVREEHPVIGRLKQLKDVRLPAPTGDVVQALSLTPEDTDDDFGSAGGRVLDELARLGVIDRLPKDRIDIPDIYRLHFKIERKGQKVKPSR
jgi:hypothetical protein